MKIEIKNSRPVIKEDKKKPIMVLFFIGILILGGGYFIISGFFFDDGLGEPTYGSQQQYEMLNTYDGSNNDVLEVNDIQGEIKTYPAVATIKYSNSDGWLPIEQFFTFENKKDVRVDNVKLAGRFNGELLRGKLYELVTVEKRMNNDSWEIAEKTYSHYTYYVDEWVQRDVSHTIVNEKHIYYITNNDFEANEIKTFKIVYLPSVEDLSGKWDIIAFLGNANNPDYSLILDPYFNFGSGSNWEGIFTNVRDNINLTLGLNGSTKYNVTGVLNSSGVGDGTITSWNFTFVPRYNYSESLENGTDVYDHYILTFNQSSGDITDLGTGVVWNAVGSPFYLPKEFCVADRCVGTLDGGTNRFNRSILDDDAIEEVNISIDFWLNISGASDSNCGTDECYIWNVVGNSGDDGIQISVRDEGLKAEVSDSGSNVQSNALLDLFDGEFHYIVVTFGGRGNKAWVDGNQLVDGHDNGTIGSADMTHNQLFSKGTGDAQFFNGTIDEFRVRTGHDDGVFLTQGEIEENYKKRVGKVIIQVAYGTSNNTWLSYENFTKSGTYNISNGAGYVKFWAFLTTLNASTETPYINYINLTSGASAPLSSSTNNTLEDLRLETSNGLNRTAEDLTLTFTPLNNKTVSPLYFNISFFKNSIFNITFLNLEGTNNTLFEFDFISGNTTRGDTWQAKINMSDANGISNFTSESLTILNSPPTVPNIIFPDNNTITINHTINLSCSGSTDDDGDEVNYEFWGDLSTNPPTTLINNYTQTIINYTLSGGGDYWWRCKANDNRSVNGISDYNTTRSFSVDRRLIIYNHSYFNDNVIEGSSNYFENNISINPLMVNDITNAIFTYNSTNYTGSIVNINSTYYKTYYSAIAPKVTATGTKDFYWNYEMELYNGTKNYNTTEIGAQTISQIYLFRCNDTSVNATSVLIFNYTFEDEDTKDNLTANFEASYTLWNNVKYINRTINFDLVTNVTINATNIGICLTPKDKDVFVEGHINYIQHLYDRRDYFYQNFYTTNTTHNTKLYLLKIVKATGTKFNIIDKLGDPVTDALIYINKYFVGIDEHKTVAMGLTDNDGESYIYINLYATYYQIIIEKAGSILKTIPNHLISSNDITIRISGEIEIPDIIDMENIVRSLNYDNDTKTITATYSGGDGDTTIKLDVYERRPENDTWICAKEIIGESGTLTCYYGNRTGGIIIASLSGEKNNKGKLLEMLEINLKSTLLKDTLGTDGLWITALIVITLAFIGLAKAEVALILGVVGLLFSVLIGFVYISWGSLIGIIIAVIYLVVRNR